MTVLVTGVAGFIGFHVARALLGRGERVVGIDNINDYYEVSLKENRLAALGVFDDFRFVKMDVSDKDALVHMVGMDSAITKIVHLAAQAGVRYSLEAPEAYFNANLGGQLSVLEACRSMDHLEHLVYASSSSVYGNSTDLPFSLDNRADQPVSLYAATKRGAELMSYSYSHIYGIPQTGLRFFTVYGPWGRPDMAPFIFIKKLLAGEPLPVFNRGNLRRDFTYIDDIVSGVLACLDRPPVAQEGTPPCRLYNLGNRKSEKLLDFIGAFEAALGVKAELDLLPMQPGDVTETFADIEATQRDFGFSPTTDLSEGIPKFVEWYLDYYDIKR